MEMEMEMDFPAAAKSRRDTQQIMDMDYWWGLQQIMDENSDFWSSSWSWPWTRVNILCHLITSEGEEVIALFRNARGGDEITPYRQILLNHNNSAGFALLADSLYLIGCTSPPSCVFFKMAMADQGRLVPCSSMLSKRSKSHVAVVNGKLYVFGGNKQPGPWGEVYDPNLQTWDALPEPHDFNLNLSSEHIMTAVLESQNQILLSSTASLNLLAFDVRTQMWEIFDRLPRPLRFTGRAIVVDRVLYCCGLGGFLYAYYLDTRLTLHTTFGLMALQNRVMLNLPGAVIPSLQHISGDSFCLFWKTPNRPFYYVNFQLSAPLNWEFKPRLQARNISTGNLDLCPPRMQLAGTLRLADTVKWFD